MTPVVLLTDAFVANGSGAFKLPDLNDYPDICPPYVTPEMAGSYTPYMRNPDTQVRYWAIPGQEVYAYSRWVGEGRPDRSHQHRSREPRQDVSFACRESGPNSGA